MKVAIVDYKAGNTCSVQFALERLGVDAIITDKVEELINADKVIFPGVGEAKTAMKALKARNLDELIKDLKQPILGICLGMQLMCDFSEEGNVSCLGIFPQVVEKFKPINNIKVPHMGWNTLTCSKNELWENVSQESFVYYVHSYYVKKGDYTIGTCDYGGVFSAALQKDNFYATQFHPEKSSSVGTQILSNFLNLSN